jgi:hypothetical protein
MWRTTLCMLTGTAVRWGNCFAFWLPRLVGGYRGSIGFGLVLVLLAS